MEEYKVFPISVIFDNHYFYCISYKLDDNSLLVIISSLKSVISVLIVSKPFTNLEMIWLSLLSPEQEARLITDEQVRYQTFSMLSGNEVGSGYL